MPGSFVIGKFYRHVVVVYQPVILPCFVSLVGNSGKKISLEHASHPCPRCKNHASVQLTRSEKQLIVLNKRIANNMRVRYECSKCNWKNEELPYDNTMLSQLQQYLASTPEDEQFTYYFSSSPPSSDIRIPATSAY